MIKRGWARGQPQKEIEDEEYRILYIKNDVEKILKTMPIRNFIFSQHSNHITPAPDVPILLSQKLAVGKANS